MILVEGDFSASVVKQKVTSDASYIDDDLVTVYWHNIAKTFSVPIANLPATPVEKVKQILILDVMIHVASDSIGSVMEQVAQGIVVDTWQNRYDTWKKRREYLLAELESSDIYDPLNPPDEPSERSSMVAEWTRR